MPIGMLIEGKCRSDLFKVEECDEVSDSGALIE